MDDSDVSLPRTSLLKAIKERLPADLRLASDSADLLCVAVTEFVQLVFSEANEISTRDSRSTLSPEHVLRALAALDMAAFSPACEAAWDQLKEEAKGQKRLAGRKTPAEQAGMTEEEQIAMQAALFAQARARSLTLADDTHCVEYASAAADAEPLTADDAAG